MAGVGVGRVSAAEVMVILKGVDEKRHRMLSLVRP
jgi:hypothetical protein